MPRAPLIHGKADDVEAAFYDALGRADLDALMALWSDDDDIACIHPGAPRLVGHAAIRGSWEAIFQRGGVHIRATQLHVTQNLMTSVHSIIEKVVAGEQGAPDIHVLATNVYLKTARGWRIVLHHASVAPGEEPSIEPASGTLH